MNVVHPFSTRRIAAFAAAGILVLACATTATNPGKAASVSAKVAQVAATMSGQSAPLADEAEAGSYLGFDTHSYPGDKKMMAWKTAKGAPYKWVGFYLPGAPCHKDNSWSGKRDTLVAMGWGLAVVYVGQQTWGRTPHPLTPAQAQALDRSGETCNANLMSADRGAEEAKDAIEKTEAQGFAKGSVIFLDIERTEKIPPRMRDYYRAWAETVLKDGRYLPGAYVHTHNAPDIYKDFKELFAAAGEKHEPRFWIASARDFSPDKAPTEVGHPFAGVWQGAIDVVRRVADVALPIDINVSNWPSPSDVTD